jgi:hypothetical protein
LPSLREQNLLRVRWYHTVQSHDMILHSTPFSLTIALIALCLRKSHGFVPNTNVRSRGHLNEYSVAWAATQGTENARLMIKSELMDSLKETPSNAPTSRKLTSYILGKIDELEKNCPTPDDDVLENLAGNWELLWTTQDRRSSEWRRNPLRAIIK